MPENTQNPPPFAPKIYCAFKRAVPINELKPHPLNPKKHPDEQIAAFKEIIKANGIRRPITVSNLSGFIVAGHGLYETLVELGATEAPVDFQDFKDEAHELAHMMADNKLAEYGVTNDVQLKAVIKQINEGGLDKEIAGVLEALENEVEEVEPAATYELQPEFDEGYDGVLIFAKTGQEYAQLATVLNLPKRMNRKGKIGVTHVLRATEFFKLCKSTSSSSRTNEPGA